MKQIFLCLSCVAISLMVRSQNRVGVGTNTPIATLDVVGTFKLTDGTEGLGKVLTSDKGGGATWKTLAPASIPTGTVGFGTWGDCTARNISEYNPVVASDGATDNEFGYSVSISGNKAIVGTQGTTNKAYIYHFNGTVWEEQQILTASDGSASDGFGRSVSISGDYAIVGAQFKMVGANGGQGKAYIYFFNGSTWVQQAILTASDAAASDYFGSSVCISGNRVIVGARNKTVAGKVAQGKAYIFQYNGSTWVQSGTGITAGDGAAGDQFGHSVGIHGDHVLVGAPYKTIGVIAGEGSAYFFKNNGGTWAQVGTGITLSFDAPQGNFGFSVCVNGNYAIVSAIGVSTGRGTAYVYNYNGTSWVRQLPLVVNETLEDGAGFGYSVCISGNYAIVSARSNTVGNNFGQGCSYIYRNVGGVWIILQKVTKPGGLAYENFGISVGMDGSRFLIGSITTADYRGMAYFGKVEQ